MRNRPEKTTLGYMDSPGGSWRSTYDVRTAKEAIRAFCATRGIMDDEIIWVDGRDQPLLNSLNSFEAGDNLVIRSTEPLGTDPELALLLVDQLVKTGVSILVTRLGGELPVATYREIASQFKGLATEADDARKEAHEAKLSAREEIASFQRQYSDRIVELLARAGFSLADLMEASKPTAEEAPAEEVSTLKVTPPEVTLGKEIKKLRMEIGLTGEAAGALIRKHGTGDQNLTRDAVSKIENGARSKDAEALFGSLIKEQHARRNPSEGNPLLVPGDASAALRAM